MQKKTFFAVSKPVIIFCIYFSTPGLIGDVLVDVKGIPRQFSCNYVPQSDVSRPGHSSWAQ